MRYENSVTSLSWIPSEAIRHHRLPFEVGMATTIRRRDELGSLDELREADRFRFANQLSAWIEVRASGEISGAGIRAPVRSAAPR